MGAADETQFLLAKFREYSRKANEASHPGVRAALEAVAREYFRRASMEPAAVEPAAGHDRPKDSPLPKRLAWPASKAS